MRADTVTIDAGTLTVLPPAGRGAWGAAVGRGAWGAAFAAAVVNVCPVDMDAPPVRFTDRTRNR